MSGDTGPDSIGQDRLGPVLLALVTALTAMGIASMAMYMPSLPSIQTEFGVTASDTQLTLTLFFVGFAFAQLIFGPLSDRYGRRPILLIGLALYAVATLACSLAWSIETLQTGRFLQGVVACVGPVVGRAVVRDTVSPSGAAAAFAVIGMALAVVPAIAPSLGGLLQASAGWRSTFWALTGASLMLIAVCALRLKETIPQYNLDATKPVTLLRIYWDLITTPYFMGYALVNSLAFAGFFSYITQSPFLFIDTLNIEPEIYGLLMIFTVMGFLVGNFLSGKLTPKIGARTTIFIACGLMFSGAILLFKLSGSLTPFNILAPMTLYTAGFGLIIPGSMAEALRPFPMVAGSASAVVGFLQFGCAAFASFVTGYVYDGSTLGLSVLIFCIVSIAMGQFLWMTRKSVPGIP